MAMFLSLTNARRTIVSRFFAALIIVLAASPITAPFATFSTAELSGEPSPLLSSSKTIEQNSLVSATGPNISPAVFCRMFVASLVNDLPSVPASRPVVLRL